MSFHTFPRDAGRFRAAIDLVLAAASPADGPTSGPGGAAAAAGGGLFAPPPAASSDGERLQADNTWSLLVGRLGTICLHYISQVAGAGEAWGSSTGAAEGSGGGSGLGKGNAGGVDGHGAAAVVGVGSSEVTAASEAALRGFGLLASPGTWEHRWPVGTAGVGAISTAESRCRTLMSSLALGSITLGGGRGAAGGIQGVSGNTPPRRSGSGAKGGVRLSVRADRNGVTGEWTRAPTLFGVLRVVWDATASTPAGGATAGGEAAQAVKLLCSSSFQALGIGGAKEGVSSPGAAGGGEGGAPPSGGAVVGDTSEGAAMPTERQRLLEAFAAAVLPAPRLLEHPLRALLVDPMLAGDAGAWWQMVSVAGEAVGADGSDEGNGGCGGGGAARRRDVAWAVANILRVRRQHVRCVEPLLVERLSA